MDELVLTEINTHMTYLLTIGFIEYEIAVLETSPGYLMSLLVLLLGRSRKNGPVEPPVDFKSEERAIESFIV
jgi:hypothetical protein